MDKVELGQEVQIYCYDRWRRGIVVRIETPPYSANYKYGVAVIDSIRKSCMMVIRDDLSVEPMWRNKIKEC